MSEPKSPDGPRPAALVVEDDHGVGTLLSILMGRMGYACTLAVTGDEALARLDGGRFDLVLTDKNLPGASGVEVARKARARLPEACVVMVSGFATESSARELDGVLDAYIEKPFQLLELEERIKLLRERRRALPSQAAAERSGGPATRRVAVLTAAGTDRERLSRAFQAGGAEVMALGGPEQIVGLPDEVVLVMDAASCTQAAYREVWRKQTRSQGVRLVLVGDPGSLRASLDAVSLGATARIDPRLDDGALAEAAKAALAGGGT